MTVMNRWFKQHERNLYTWKSPGDLFRNQIDYISINSRYRNAITICKTKPGADCNSDHNLLFAMVRCNLKIIRKSKKAPQLEFKALRNTPEMQKLYSIEVQNRFSELISNNNDEPRS